MAARMYTIASCGSGIHAVGDLCSTVFEAGEICSTSHQVIETDDGFVLRLTISKTSMDIPLCSETEEEAITEAYEYLLSDYKEDHRLIIYPAENGIIRLLETDEIRTVYGELGTQFENDDALEEHALHADHNRETLNSMADLLLLRGAINRSEFEQLVAYFEEYIPA